MAKVIAFEHVSRVFDGVRAVDDLSLTISQGTIFGLLGPSGSGKTTAIRLMIGVYAPSDGEVTVLGLPPTRWPARVRERVGYMPQISFLYPHLSVSENINFSASLYGMGFFKRRSRVREMLDVVELTAHRSKLVGQLSGGMRRRLALASALVHNPALVILDEPTAGIDPVLRQHFWDYFRRLRDDGKTILVTSHYVGEAEYCDRVAVIEDGRLVADGTPGELRRKAIGGDALDVVTPGLTQQALRVARDVPGVRAVEPISLESMRVFVAEAGPLMPRLAKALSEHGVRVREIREYHPTFDEVFASLMKKAA